MKKILLIGFVYAASISAFSQALISDSIQLGTSYANQCFYQLSTQTKTNNVNGDWDIKFATSLFSVAARINSGAGVELYLPTNDDTTNFTSNTIDTLGATRLRDGNDDWESSSFVSFGTGHPDYGWVQYGGGGSLVGTKVLILKTSSGSWKKIQLLTGTPSGIYTVRFANLDGSGVTTQTINKSTYSNRLHIYFDIDANAVLDKEPGKNDWELVFRKYEANLGGGVYYGVTGGLSNANVGIIEARNMSISDAKTNWGSYAFDSAIDVIGHDWKDFDMVSSQWIVDDSLSYIIQDKTGNIYQMVFTSWAGSATGWFYFTVQQLGFASVDEQNSFRSFGLYPNPTEDILTITYQTTISNQVTFQVLDLSGKVIKTLYGAQNNLVNITNLDVSNLPKGTYIVRGITSNGIVTDKFIKL